MRAFFRLTLLLSAALAGPLQAETIVLTAERMFDAESGRIVGPARILVRDGLIESDERVSDPALATAS